LVLLLLGLIVMRYIAKNKYLKAEISERSIAKKALAESEQRYRLLYENASIGIYQTTPDGKVLLSNSTLLNILGYNSFDELKERNIEDGDFDPTYSRTEFKKTMEKEGQIQGLEHTWKRQDGKLVYIRENAKAIRNDQGEIIYYDGTIEDITDRKNAEKALQYSEKRFRQIADLSREVVWEVDSTGLYTYISPLSRSVLGYSPDELIGKKYFYELHPEDSRDDYRKACMGIFQRKENFHEFIHEVLNGSGTQIWITTNGGPILDENGILTGYRGADNDITERIQRESLLKKLTLAVEQSPVSIVITSIDGAIEYGNPKSCETTGYSLEELSGQNPRILKSGFKPSSAYKELWDTIISGKIWHGEFLNRKKNGDLYWETATISPIFDNEGNIINFLAVKEDITNIKKLISELQVAKDQAESGDLLKSAFIKSISHEIRTPLNGIVGMSEQILSPTLSQQTKEQLLVLIKESSARLINTVNSYMDISMIVSGNIVVKAEPFDLNQLLITIKNEILPFCESKNLELQLLYPTESEIVIVNTDAEILIKIFMHLLNNAVKFTNYGSVVFGYELKNDTIEFIVKDTGIGIDKNYLPYIFESFTQADVSDTREYEGSGLGLSIAYRLVHLLSGEIRVESERNKGATFYLTFLLSDFIHEPLTNK
jgi:PAS domain S-box-containing protein